MLNPDFPFDRQGERHFGRCNRGRDSCERIQERSRDCPEACKGRSFQVFEHLCQTFRTDRSKELSERKEGKEQGRRKKGRKEGRKEEEKRGDIRYIHI